MLSDVELNFWDLAYRMAYSGNASSAKDAADVADIAIARRRKAERGEQPVEKPTPDAGGGGLPRYRCHKEVLALKIKAIVDPNAGLPEDDGERVLTFSDAGYEACAFVVDREYIRRHKPHVGGYYVVYSDGYKSFSPALAFEEGYTKI